MCRDPGGVQVHNRTRRGKERDLLGDQTADATHHQSTGICSQARVQCADTNSIDRERERGTTLLTSASVYKGKGLEINSNIWGMGDSTAEGKRNLFEQWLEGRDPEHGDICGWPERESRPDDRSPSPRQQPARAVTMNCRKRCNGGHTVGSTTGTVHAMLIRQCTPASWATCRPSHEHDISCEKKCVEPA